jgi:hypothetical protein
MVQHIFFKGFEFCIKMHPTKRVTLKEHVYHWRHDTQHNDIQHNKMENATLSIMAEFSMLVFYAECRNAECHKSFIYA